MRIELLWFSGCPNWQKTDARLRQAVLLAGVDGDVVLIEVTTPEDAERFRFRGSPTVLVDGRDPFAEVSDPVGLSCRVFRTPDGQHARRVPVPSVRGVGAAAVVPAAVSRQTRALADESACIRPASDLPASGMRQSVTPAFQGLWAPSC